MLWQPYYKNDTINQHCKETIFSKAKLLTRSSLFGNSYFNVVAMPVSITLPYFTNMTTPSKLTY